MRILPYIFLSAVFGLSLTLAFAPYNYLGLGFVAISGVAYICYSADSLKKVTVYSFVFAFVHHLTGLYWIANSLLVEPDKFAWLVPFSVSLIPLYLSVFIVLPFTLLHKFRYRGFPYILMLSVLWVIFELLRGKLFTGFPWNLLGYTALYNLKISQLASFGGVYLLSFVLCFAFLLPFYILLYYKDIFALVFGREAKAKVKNYKVGKFGSLGLLLLTVFCIYFVVILYANNRLNYIYNNAGQEQANNPQEQAKILRLIQPNIPQNQKMTSDSVYSNLERLFALSAAKIKDDNLTLADKIDMIIWPEAVFPFDLASETLFVKELSYRLNSLDNVADDVLLALGSIRRDYENKKVYNSLQYINKSGLIYGAYYDKSHLVPFGEYVPLRDVLPFVSAIASNIGDFSKGQGVSNIELAQFGEGLPTILPLICYEVIFPDEIIDNNSIDEMVTDTDILVNITNDAWFGDSSGPYQHLAISQMRAIEQGVPMLRIANTGISAVISASGEIEQQLNLNNTGFIDYKFYKTKSVRKTIYAQYGNKIIILLLAFFGVVAIFFNRKFNK